MECSVLNRSFIPYFLPDKLRGPYRKTVRARGWGREDCYTQELRAVVVSEQDLHKSKPVKFPALLGGGGADNTKERLLVGICWGGISFLQGCSP